MTASGARSTLDIAGRHARYSTAGDANTWKVGLTWDTPIPGIRFRATQSRDIRAPNLSELEPPPVGANGCFNNDFFAADVNHNLIGVTAGNLSLKPERSYTTEAGVVWQPDFLPGFQASVDYYRIGLAKAHFQLWHPEHRRPVLLPDARDDPVRQLVRSDRDQDGNGSTANHCLAGPHHRCQQRRADHRPAVQCRDHGDRRLRHRSVLYFDLEDYDVPGSFTCGR